MNLWRKSVKLKSPVRLKDLEGKFGISFKAFVHADGSRRELFDTEKLVAIELQKNTCIVLLDARDRLWEICKDNKGRHKLRRLDEE